jgi:hypothetical protein
MVAKAMTPPIRSGLTVFAFTSPEHGSPSCAAKICASAMPATLAVTPTVIKTPALGTLGTLAGRWPPVQSKLSREPGVPAAPPVGIERAGWVLQGQLRPSLEVRRSHTHAREGIATSWRAWFGAGLAHAYQPAWVAAAGSTWLGG